MVKPTFKPLTPSIMTFMLRRIYQERQHSIHEDGKNSKSTSKQ